MVSLCFFFFFAGFVYKSVYKLSSSVGEKKKKITIAKII